MVGCIVNSVINDKPDVFWHFKVFLIVFITLFILKVILLFPHLNFKYFEMKNGVYFLSASLIIINKLTDNLNISLTHIKGIFQRKARDHMKIHEDTNVFAFFSTFRTTKSRSSVIELTGCDDR